VVVALVLAGIFDGLSGNPVHSILLFAVALGLVAEAAGLVPAPSLVPSDGPVAAASTGSVVRRHPVLTAGAIGYAILVGGFGRYSWPATAAVIVPGATAIALAWRTAPAPGTTISFDRAGTMAWASLFVALGLFELTNLLLQPSLTTDSYAHPTLSALTDPLLAAHPGRSIGLLVWLASGWFLLGR